MSVFWDVGTVSCLFPVDSGLVVGPIDILYSNHTIKINEALL